MQEKLPRTVVGGKRRLENNGENNGARFAVTIPYVRPAWLLEDGDILDLETFALIYDAETESTRYLARVVGSVGTVAEFDGANLVFREGDALRIHALRVRQNGGDKRHRRFMAEQRRQCDDATAMLEAM